MNDDPLGTFTAACARNGATVIGPVDMTVAAKAIAELTDGVIALPVGNQLIDACGVADAIGGRALLADDPQWTARIEGVSLGVTGSIVAVAETGTVAVACAPGHPRALTLIPPHHVCLVDADSVVDSLEAAFERLPAELPSDLHWISGPSRTGDLEMISTIGIHGPLAVTVVVVRN